jgi:hypothetical protein
VSTSKSVLLGPSRVRDMFDRLEDDAPWLSCLYAKIQIRSDHNDNVTRISNESRHVAVVTAEGQTVETID